MTESRDYTPFKPTPPKMGGLIQVKHDLFSAWTGGKPKDKWEDGLVTPDGYQQPSQQRPSYDDKGFTTRCTGFDTKFDKTDNLQLFSRNLLDRFQTHGMDSITYLPDPSDGSMVCALTHHTRFTVDAVKTSIEPQLKEYDQYDKSNDRGARLTLLDSLTPKLRLEMEERMPDEPNFPLLWMMLIQIIQSDSMGKFARIEAEIKSQHPKQYAGQNIAEMALAISSRATTLHTAGLFNHQLNATILKQFLMADGNNEYRFELMKVQSELNKALKQERFMTDKTAANDYLNNLGLGFRQICQLAEDKYREALGDGDWPPARNNKDSKLPPAGYYSATELNALVQHFSSSSTKSKNSGGCYICGAPDHWAADCPHKQDSASGRHSGSRPPRGGGRGGRSGRGGRGGCGRRDSRGHHQGRSGRGGGGRGFPNRSSRTRDLAPWRTVPPPPGTPETKEYNGRTFHWCAKCTPPCWNTTHSTSQHRGSTNETHQANTGSVSQARPLPLDPSAWMVDCDVRNLNLEDWTPVVNGSTKKPTTACSPVPVSNSFALLTLSVDNKETKPSALEDDAMDSKPPALKDPPVRVVTVLNDSDDTPPEDLIYPSEEFPHSLPEAHNLAVAVTPSPQAVTTSTHKKRPRRVMPPSPFVHRSTKKTKKNKSPKHKSPRSTKSPPSKNPFVSSKRKNHPPPSHHRTPASRHSTPRFDTLWCDTCSPVDSPKIFRPPSPARCTPKISNRLPSSASPNLSSRTTRGHSSLHSNSTTSRPSSVTILDTLVVFLILWFVLWIFTLPSATLWTFITIFPGLCLWIGCTGIVLALCHKLEFVHLQDFTSPLGRQIRAFADAAPPPSPSRRGSQVTSVAPGGATHHRRSRPYPLRLRRHQAHLDNTPPPMLSHLVNPIRQLIADCLFVVVSRRRVVPLLRRCCSWLSRVANALLEGEATIHNTNTCVPDTTKRRRQLRGDRIRRQQHRRQFIHQQRRRGFCPTSQRQSPPRPVGWPHNVPPNRRFDFNVPKNVAKPPFGSPLRPTKHPKYPPTAAAFMFSQADADALLKASLQSPTQLRAAMPDGACYPIVWDSGASVSMSFCEDDFHGTLDTSPETVEQLKVNGIASDVEVKGRGTVLWHVLDTSGMLRALKVPALYIPEAKIRLLSTSSLLQTYQGETISINPRGLTLSGVKKDKFRRSIDVLLNPVNNLPTSYGYDTQGLKAATATLANTITTVHNNNINLNPVQRELMKWHIRFGHINFKAVQFLMHTGVLATSEAQRKLHAQASRLTHPPMCAACQFGKQRQRSAPGRTTKVESARDGALKRDHLLPGQCIAVDHFVCSTKGRLFESKGKTKDDRMYCGGAIFVDMASGHVDCIFQTHLSTHETLKAKESFELKCRDVGVVPQQYLSDNGSAFTSKEYTSHLQQFRQIQRFAGVGAHHHNGVAERAIQSIMSIARTMMLHSAIHWPDLADSSLWPMAVRHAAYLFNHVPNPTTGLSPTDIFTRTRFEHNRFHDLHVWGCPVYVLDKKISDGRKLPRWKPRSHRCMFMGLSPNHASSVPLVLNPSTGAITPQFHVVFDDWFETIATDPTNLPDFQSPEWSRLFGDSTFQFLPDDDDDTGGNHEAPTTVDTAAATTNLQHQQQIFRSMESTAPTQPLPGPLPTPAPPLEGAPPSQSPPPLVVASDVEPSVVVPSSPPPTTPSPQQRENPPPQQPQSPPTPSVPKSEPISAPTTTPTTVSTSPVRRSNRNRRAPTRLIHDMDSSKQSYANTLAAHADAHADEPTPTIAYYLHHVLLQQSNLFNLEVCKAAVSDPDIFSFDDILTLSDLPQWKAAAQKEIGALELKGTWIEVPLTDATSKVLPGTWVFKYKRSPTGEIKKHKARYCVRGDLQEGEFETFAPVVSWSTIRLVLIFALTQNWILICVDFSNAFVQATLKEPVWIHLPRGYRSSKPFPTCLKLKKSLYGLSVAPRLWYEHLRDALLEDGFKQSDHDICLFLKANMIVFLYVDDCGVAAPKQKDIDDFVARLNKKGFELTQDGDFAEYLGIKFVVDKTANTITMTQPGLINKIVQARQMDNCNPNKTPASTTALGSDPTGPPMKEAWSYPSVIGMLLYLSTNTRPDIAFAVSQVARFGSQPKQSHASAVKMIVRYLSGTVNRGTIFTPNNNYKIDCYVDADFAGLHGREDQDNPTSAKSRTGYILFFCGSPLLWKSKLQTETALSTFHAEYVALSAAMRQLIVVQRVLQDMVACLPFTTDTPQILAEVFEDNNSAFLLANNQRLTDRSKWLNCKLHFFWEYVNDGFAKVSKISTHDQRADYLTKGLVAEKFIANRKQNQGW